MSFTTHQSILSEARLRQDEGCERFYHTYAPLIRLHGRDCGITGSDLDDLVQLVLIGFFRQCRFHYDAARGNFRNYLRKLIRAKSCDLLRTQYRRHQLLATLPPEAEAQTDRRFDREYRRCLLERALQELRAESTAVHYQILDSHLRQNLDPGELAARYCLPKPTVYSILRRQELKLIAKIRSLAADPNY